MYPLQSARCPGGRYSWLTGCSTTDLLLWRFHKHSRWPRFTWRHICKTRCRLRICLSRRIGVFYLRIRLWAAGKILSLWKDEGILFKSFSSHFSVCLFLFFFFNLVLNSLLYFGEASLKSLTEVTRRTVPLVIWFMSMRLFESLWETWSGRLWNKSSLLRKPRISPLSAFRLFHFFWKIFTLLHLLLLLCFAQITSSRHLYTHLPLSSKPAIQLPHSHPLLLSQQSRLLPSVFISLALSVFLFLPPPPCTAP